MSVETDLDWEKLKSTEQEALYFSCMRKTYVRNHTSPFLKVSHNHI